MKRQKLKKQGFTLIEVLVVVTIIGILAGVILSSLGESRDQARVASAQSHMKSLHTAMELLFTDTGLYPHKENRYCPPMSGANNEIDLSEASAGLVTTDGSFPGWDGPYIINAIDSWGTPFFFDQDYKCTAGALGCDGIADTGGSYSSVIVSCGPNKQLDVGGNGGACAYDDDNIVLVLCRD